MIHLNDQEVLTPTLPAPILTKRSSCMEGVSLKSQVISFCITLVLILISVFVFKNVTIVDYILMILGAVELIMIIMMLVKRKKKQ